MILGIGHITFKVKNMDEALNFYCNGLGFKKVCEIKDANGNPWIVYIKIKENQFIELVYSKDGDEKTDTVIGFSHFCLEVSDIQLLAQHLRDKGIKIDVEPRQGVDKNHQCWVKDPDGNRIEFMQMDPNSPQMGNN